MAAQAGPHNALIDITGIRVGHHTAVDEGYLTGTTVVLAPDGGMTASVDVRGGGPATHETDLLAPAASVERIHALVLTGGSAFGLVTCTGVMNELALAGVGVPVGPTAGEVVPIVPGAALLDLGRGGDFIARPTLEFGSLALRAAQADIGGPAPERPPAERTGPQGAATTTAVAGRAGAQLGSIGAGTGAVASNLKGGIGTASVQVPGVGTVAALVAVNSAGSPIDDRTGELLGAHLLLPADGPLPALSTAARDALLLATAPRPGKIGFSDKGEHDQANVIGHTTLVVVGTDATLTKAQCAKMAAVAQNGLARALNPVHTIFDGDIVFGLATGSTDPPDLIGFHQITVAAADVVTRSIVRALLAAQSVATAGGNWPSYSAVISSAGNAGPDIG
jgi:L-aminopeptidase/D-esterase-like protein